MLWEFGTSNIYEISQQMFNEIFYVYTVAVKKNICGNIKYKYMTYLDYLKNLSKSRNVFCTPLKFEKLSVQYQGDTNYIEEERHIS